MKIWTRDEMMVLDDVEKDVIFKLLSIQLKIDMIDADMKTNKTYYHGDHIVDDDDRNEYKAALTNSIKKLIDIENELEEIYDNI